MAGERFASITITGSTFGTGAWIEIKFKGQFQRFSHESGSGYIFGTSVSGTFEEEAQSRWANFVNAIEAHINSMGWGNEFVVTHTHFMPPEGAVVSTHTVIIEATQYGSIYNFSTNYTGGGGWNITFQNLFNISPIVVSAEVYPVKCGGSSTGIISLNVENAFAPAIYQWSNGTTTSEPGIYDVAAGNYSVTVIDSQGTSTILNNIIVAENPRIEINGIISGSEITIEVAGGVGPFSFQWTDGPTTQNRTGLATGRYSVTVTDSNGCQRAGSFLVKNEWFQFSQNPIPFQLAASAHNSKSNLSFLCEIWIEENYLSNNFTLAYSAEQPADIYGKTTFFLEEVLDGYLKAHFPSFGQKTVFRASNAFKRYQLKYREKYGEPAVPDPVSTSSIRYVLVGGLDFEENYTKTFFSSYLTYQKPFFTWQPRIKKVIKEQPEYLYFMPLDAGTTSFLVKAKLHFSQGTSETFTLFNQAGARQFELWGIPAGFNLLNLQARAAGRAVLQYELWVEDPVSGNPLSETRKYVLENAYYRHIRFFHYQNSIGGIDTLLATGAASMHLPVEKETVVKNLVPGYVAIDGDQETVFRGGRPYLALSTGYQLSREERVAFQDFRFSETVKLLGPDRYLVGQPQFKNADVDDEFTDMKAIDFEFHLAYRSHYTGALKRKGYAVPVEETPIPIGNGGNDQ